MEPKASSHLDYIDALRGYAILLVMIVHAGIVMPEATAYVSWGARGVQLFFVISAVTLMASWERRHDGAAAFYVRRALMQLLSGILVA